MLPNTDDKFINLFYHIDDRMNKNSAIRSFMRKNQIKSDDMAVYLGITGGING